MLRESGNKQLSLYSGLYEKKPEVCKLFSNLHTLFYSLEQVFEIIFKCYFPINKFDYILSFPLFKTTLFQWFQSVL